MTVSIAIPSLSGGGAEKVTLLLVRELVRTKKISKVYVGSQCEASDALDCEVVVLGGRRASEGLVSFLKNVAGDPADSFMLTLGYVNFAPFLRMLRPSARIVVRIGNTPTPETAGLSRMAKFRYIHSTRFATHMATEVVAQCRYMADDVKDIFKLSQSKIRIIYNPVEPALVDWPDDQANTIQEPYLFVAASFKPQKDLETLVAGYAQAKNSLGRRLVIAGVSPKNVPFRNLMKRYDLDDNTVICLGFRSDTYNLIQHADLCILTSLYEGFSNFLLEAAAMGKHIIATDCPGGSNELFKFYNNVSTFSIGDYEHLSRLIELPRHDVSRAHALKTLEPFSFQRFVQCYNEAMNIGSVASLVEI